MPASWLWGLRALTAAALFLAGYKVAEWRLNAAKLEDVQAALENLRQEQLLAEVLSRNLLAENLKETAKFLQSEQEARVIYQNAIKKVRVYIPACTVSSGAISLRNEVARTHSTVPVDGAPRTAGGAATDTRTP